jgi:cbb3-type cytochrome oxidase subunit 1
VIAAEPMWLWRTIGGLLMVSSHVVFAFNVWAMRPQRADAPAVAAVAVRSPA